MDLVELKHKIELRELCAWRLQSLIYFGGKFLGIENYRIVIRDEKGNPYRLSRKKHHDVRKRAMSMYP